MQVTKDNYFELHAKFGLPKHEKFEKGHMLMEKLQKADWKQLSDSKMKAIYEKYMIAYSKFIVAVKKKIEEKKINLQILTGEKEQKKEEEKR